MSDPLWIVHTPTNFSPVQCAIASPEHSRTNHQPNDCCAYDCPVGLSDRVRRRSGVLYARIAGVLRCP